MLAGHEEEPVRSRSRERGEGVHRSGVRRQHAFQSRERLGLRAAERRIVGRAVRVRKPVQLEGVAVEDEIGRSSAFRIQRLEKDRELVPPAEILLDAPLPRRVPAEAHVQVGDDRDEPG